LRNKIKHWGKLIRDLIQYSRSPGAVVSYVPKTISEDLIEDRWCFIIQGPLDLMNKRDIESLRLAYPRCRIILTTWYSKKNYHAYFTDLSIDVLFNTKPVNTGVMNSNLQLIQMKKAIKHIDDSKIKYVVKLRIDAMPKFPHRLVPYFKKLERQFPNRVWGVDINTKSTLPFSLSDICIWSNIENFKSYWISPELVSTNINPSTYIEKSDAFKDMQYIEMFKPAEAHFCHSYLSSKSKDDVSFSLQSWNKSLQKEFGVFSSLYIGLYFNKYSHFHTVYSRNTDDYLGFEDWLCRQY